MPDTLQIGITTPEITFVEMQQRAEQAEQALSAERTHVEDLLNRLRALGQEP